MNINKLYLLAKHKKEIIYLFKKYLLDVEVWAYGSRVNGKAHSASDLDLVLRSPHLQEIVSSKISELREAFAESNIPFIVEVRDWAVLPKSFHKEIKKNYIVLISRKTPSKRNKKKSKTKTSSAFKQTEAGKTPKNWAVKKEEKTKRTKIIASTKERQQTNEDLKSNIKTNLSWPMVELGDVLNLEYGKALKKSERKNGYYPVFGSNGIDGHHSEYLVEAPLIVVGRKGSAGKVNYYEQNGFPIDTTFYVKLRKPYSINLKYLFFQLKTVNFNKLSSQSAVPGINRNHVYSIKIPLPPLEEQKEIAGILSQIQKLIEAQDKLIKKTKELKKSTMKHLFTYGVKKEKTKQTEAGKTPKSWAIEKEEQTKRTKIIASTKERQQTKEDLKPNIKINPKWPIVKLSEIAEISSGNSAPQNKEFFKNGIYPFCRTSDVGKAHISSDLKETQDYLSNEGIKGLRLFKKGTILFPKSGASIFLNHRVMLGMDSYVSNHLATIISDENQVIPKFLFHLLCLVDAKKIAGEQHYPSLKLSIIKQIQVPLSPLEEQKKISNILQKIDKKITAHEKKKSSLNALFKTMLNKLMTGKIRVHKMNISNKFIVQ